METKKTIVFLTGAGISAESGIPTFRDSNGLWNNHNVEEVASIEGWERNPELVLDFYNQRRADLVKVQPNDAHLAITKLQEKYNVIVITQNVDDLHERAGTDMVLHLHGELAKVCSSANREKCVHELPLDVPIRMGDKAEDGSQLRPYIVWFGEDVTNIQDACNIVQHADIFVVVGTSLEVNPAASLVIYSRAEQNFVIDPAAPKDMLEELDPTLHVINLPATEGMKVLLEVLKME